MEVLFHCPGVMAAVSTPLATRKAPAVQHAVANLRMAGMSLREIASKLSLSVNTVRKLITMTDVDTCVKSLESQCFDIAPKAIKTIGKAVESNPDHAFRLIEGLGVLGKDRANHASNNVNVNVLGLVGRDRTSATVPALTSPSIDVPVRDVLDPSSREAGASPKTLGLTDNFSPVNEASPKQLSLGFGEHDD